jgi:Leucine-rich repeat (LRR) protein
LCSLLEVINGFPFVSLTDSDYGYHNCSHHSTQPWKQNLRFKSNFNEPEKVEKLTIDFKPFDRIVPGFAEIFPNLKKLEIYNQNIKFIEVEDFANLEKLEGLYLAGNPLKTLKENVFDKLGNLKQLHLNGCQLESLPTKIFSKLTKLEKIRLGRNQLTHLDKELFANNLELKTISLNGNKLQKIDVDFTKLPNIEYISMRDNDCINFSYGKTESWAPTHSIQEFQSAINQNCPKLQ